MKQYVFVLGALLLSQPALADATTHQFGSRAPIVGSGGETTMTVETVSPGVLNITLSKNAGVWLNEKSGSQKAKKHPDESGKGTVEVVSYADDPALFAGTQLCITGAGNDWAGIGSQRYDLSKTSCAPMAETVTNQLTFTKESFGKVTALTFVIVDDKGKRVAWGSHPFGSSRHIFERNKGGKDVVTLISLDATGSAVDITPEALADYQKYYLAITQ